jgi:hypothetical protein
MSQPVWDGLARLAECHEVFVWDVGRSWRCVDVLWDDLRVGRGRCVVESFPPRPRRADLAVCEGRVSRGVPCVVRRDRRLPRPTAAIRALRAWQRSPSPPGGCRCVDLADPIGAREGPSVFPRRSGRLVPRCLATSPSHRSPSTESDELPKSPPTPRYVRPGESKSRITSWVFVPSRSSLRTSEAHPDPPRGRRRGRRLAAPCGFRHPAAWQNHTAASALCPPGCCAGQAPIRACSAASN